MIRCHHFWFSLVLWGLTSLCAHTGLSQTTITVRANALHSIGGEQELDRAKYFNHAGTTYPPKNTNLGNLHDQAFSETGLNLIPGRVTSEFDQLISITANNPRQYLPEDPNRPGFYDHASLVSRLQGFYRNFVLTDDRYAALRQHENALLVNGGRAGDFFPDFLYSNPGDKDILDNYAGYAEFLNVYLEEVVYGPNAFLPYPSDRLYIEIMNEPNWPLINGAGVGWEEGIKMHREVTQFVKEQHPEAKLGGPSCCDFYGSGGRNTWDLAQQLMDDMKTWQTAGGDHVELDFWTIHPYERYTVKPDGSYSQDLFESPGHTASVMDLFHAYSAANLDGPKEFAITEYGSWNRTQMADGTYGSYTRSQQQWDLSRNVMEKMMVFMERPDRIANATPFVFTRAWVNDVPTPESFDIVFWEQDASGNWSETILAEMFRMLAPVKGQYVDVQNSDPDLQTIAFRDGDQLHLVMKNMRTTGRTIDLNAMAGLGGVESAEWSRIYRSGGTNQYLPDVDVSNSWQNLTLEGEASAVLTLQLSGPQVFDHALDTQTHYGVDTMMAITPSLPFGTIVTASLEDVQAATLRFAYGETSQIYPDFTVLVNGTPFTVVGQAIALDDGDVEFVTREVDVPVGILQDGQNQIEFLVGSGGSGGSISAVVLETHRSVGDFDSSGKLSADDLGVLYQHFGAAAGGSRYDLTSDGMVDAQDVEHWVHRLRNAHAGDADVDGDIDARDAVTVLANWGLSQWNRGDFDGNDLIDPADLEWVTGGFTGAGPSEPLGPAEVGSAVQNPNLVYNPANGEVALEADGQLLLAFHLSGVSDFLAAADFGMLDSAIGQTSTFVDNGLRNIGWMSAKATSRIGYGSPDTVELGEILPLGLDLVGLAEWLEDASWAGEATGGRFDLLVLATSLSGDFNGDGTVDLADYTVWRDTLGSTNDLRADADGDLKVTSTDYGYWRSNFGRTANPSAYNSVIPEPTPLSLGLVLLVLAAVAARWTGLRSFSQPQMDGASTYPSHCAIVPGSPRRWRPR